MVDLVPRRVSTSVVAAARAKGARHIIWLTYREDVQYKLLTGERAERGVRQEQQTLRDKVASGAFPDVLLAQWYPHTPADNGWFARDGVHLTLEGALGVADYIARWVAHIEGLPCAKPTVPGRPRGVCLPEPGHSTTDCQRHCAVPDVVPVRSSAGQK